HWYLLHRKTNTEKMRADVAALKKLFPKAKIIAGSYALDYKSPCTDSPTDKLPCYGQQELNYFKESLQIQATLMKSGLFEAIEFFPAWFGNEEKRTYTDCEDKHKKLFNEKPEIALPKCIANTKVMRAEALKILNAIKPTPTPTKKPTVTPTPFGKKGDFNKDGKVDNDDYNILLANFGKTNAAYNLTGDNTIDIFDYNIFVSVWGK
ncbi:hypothetical protein MUP56_01275, partial [Patescibacteria group bacterium]|nr:hypothetical protein [Patescibacteria group bacterium]